ncbi:hypothetical protein O181_029303 [Austropuccinia psidii MF-1]|uniref:Secreted protein n=1 Tax=Austropuccinia psidii MF-1 TaxID=1389203 RepID=A0A9Q3CTA0_9BASI|nr:hypothetical protein [Austropuccinia psidii MF-1]
MFKYHLLALGHALTLLCDVFAAKLTSQPCAVEYAVLRGNSTYVGCTNTATEYFHCPKASCYSLDMNYHITHDLHFQNCTVNSTPNLYIWPDFYHVNREHFIVTVVRGRQSTSPTGTRTELNDNAICRWKTLQDPNARRQVCDNCERYSPK